METKIFLLNLLLGTLGILFYSLWSSKKFIIDDTTETWYFSKFLKENYKRWIIIFALLLICNIVVFAAPEAFNKITQLTGLDLTDFSPGGFFTLAILLHVAVKK